MNYELEGKISLSLDTECYEFLETHDLGPNSLDIEPDIEDIKEALVNEITSWLNALHIEVEVELKEKKWIGK